MLVFFRSEKIFMFIYYTYKYIKVFCYQYFVFLREPLLWQRKTEFIRKYSIFKSYFLALIEKNTAVILKAKDRIEG